MRRSSRTSLVGTAVMRTLGAGVCVEDRSEVPCTAAGPGTVTSIGVVFISGAARTWRSCEDVEGQGTGESVHGASPWPNRHRRRAPGCCDIAEEDESGCDPAVAVPGRGADDQGVLGARGRDAEAQSGRLPGSFAEPR